MTAPQSVSGRVSGVQNRAQVSGSSYTSTTQILVFRLTPEFGGPAMHVELRGRGIDGSLVDGELVEVFGSADAGRGVFLAERIVSRDSGLVVQPAPEPPASKVIAVVFGLFFLGVLTFILVVAVQILRNV